GGAGGVAGGGIPGARWVGGGEKRWKEGDACGGGPG
ncbi:unnamed protein product, partial [Brassica rapa subsp. trilocularis]